MTDVGEKLFCIVTAHNAYGSGVAHSNVVGPVVGGGAPTAPAMTDLWSWVKADAGTYQDYAALTTPATANADPIGTWADQSGNGKHWAQTTAKPTLRTNVAGPTAALPVIRFSHAGATSLLVNSMGSLTGCEIFIVLKATNDPGLAGGSTGHLWRMGTSAEDPFYPYSDGVIYDDWGTNTRKTTGNPSTPLTAFHLYNVVSISGEWTSFINGTQHYTTATNTAAFSVAPALGTWGTGSEFDGDIAEMLIYSAKCSAPDKATTKAYLAGKYGLTVA